MDFLSSRIPPARLQALSWWGFGLVHVLIALMVLALMVPSAAWAQDAAVAAASDGFGPAALIPARSHDFGPMVLAILSFLEPTIMAVVSLLGLFVLQRLSAWLGLRIDDSRRAALDQALAYAVTFAMEKVGDRARAGIPVNLKSEAIAAAAGYAERSVPGALKHFGIGEQRLAEMVESRLEGVLFDPVTEPAEGDTVASRLRPGPFAASAV